jgi:hypothetical protein
VHGGSKRSEDLAKPWRTASPRPASTPPLSKSCLALAFLVAASDVVAYGTAFGSPVQWSVDRVTALLLFELLGWRWALQPRLVTEAIPGITVFPVWLLVIASVALRVRRSAPRHALGRPLRVVSCPVRETSVSSSMGLGRLWPRATPLGRRGMSC